MSEECEERLLGWGVDCLAPGEPFTAYGIIENDIELMEMLLDDPEVVAVRLQEPCAGK